MARKNAALLLLSVTTECFAFFGFQLTSHNLCGKDSLPESRSLQSPEIASHLPLLFVVPYYKAWIFLRGVAHNGIWDVSLCCLSSNGAGFRNQRSPDDQVDDFHSFESSLHAQNLFFRHFVNLHMQLSDSLHSFESIAQSQFQENQF